MLRTWRLRAGLLCLLLAPAAPSLAGPVTVAPGGATLREGAGLGYAPVGRILEGRQVDLVQRQEGWALVRDPRGLEGWVHTSFLEGLAEPATERPEDPEEARRLRRESREREKAEAEARRKQRREEKAKEKERAEERRRVEKELQKDQEAARVRAREEARRAEELRAEAEDRLGRPEAAAEKPAPAPVEPPSDARDTLEGYEPLDSDRILDEVVEGLYGSGQVGPGMVRPGPDPPAEARRVQPAPEPAARAPRPEAQEAPARTDLRPEPSPARVRALDGLPPPQPGALIVEEVVARVGDDVITKSELDERLEILERMPQTTAGPGADALERVRSRILPIMVDEKLLMRQAELLGVNKERVYQAGKDMFMKRFGIESDLQLLEFLDQAGMDLGDFRNVVLRSRLPELVLFREVMGNIRVTEKEIRDWYEENKDSLVQPEQIHLKEIVLLEGDGGESELQGRLVETLSRLEQGELFDDVARQVSQAPSASEGGDLGRLLRADLAPEMARRVDRLVDGELGVEETPYGYHLLLLVRRDPPIVPPLEVVEEDVRREIREEKALGDREAYLESLRGRSFIQIDPRYAMRYGDMNDR